MSERAPTRKFSSPQEEIAYLRSQVESRGVEPSHEDFDTEAKQALERYQKTDADAVVRKEHRLGEHELASLTERTETSGDQLGDIIELARTRGVKNALTVLEKVGDPYLNDEVHRLLIQDIKAGRPLASFDERSPAWDVLHMTLFEVSLPEEGADEDDARTMHEFVTSMEQFFSGMESIGRKKGRSHYTLEVAVSDKSEDIIFYVAVPTEYIDLFEKQVLSLFPDAMITEQQNDYNIFVDAGEALVATASLKEFPIYPLKMHEAFDRDPLFVLLNSFSKIERDSGGAAVQIVIQPGENDYRKRFKRILKSVQKGTKVKKAVRESTVAGEFLELFKDAFASSEKKDDEKKEGQDSEDIELFQEKTTSPAVLANIRLVVSAAHTERAEQILRDVEASFNQFENPKSNGLTFTTLKGGLAKKALEAFSFRKFVAKNALPLSLLELASMLHFPGEGVDSAPAFKQSRAKGAPAPLGLPREGTFLGVNTYRNVATDVFLAPEDRLRHFYIIGQTGTGKTTLMKNMIIQDIQAGNGVCMIDPHGTDITDVLAAVPKEREDDVIYIDPSYMERVVGLNMLEYDERKPEQKTFVVNELFSIFQKLYGAVPESMGPMFEQYFRNATLLVLEDPESGSTLLDVSKVMADAEYRQAKLEKAKNPVVVQFWKDIATKAGGEAALENIVPYITSKFDVFTANEYMRPIVGQQESSFDFRQIMDEQKILLVNLSKGRLGEINANLIGMIVVGKILMAALSRVDDVSRSTPPFYLHMDEFQNITTDSISAILSEARKYRLGLTVAHQFIAQLEEKISDAVFGNVGSIASFRVGPEDAEFLEKQFSPTFNAHDLMNIENRHAYLRILADGTPTKPFDIATAAPQEPNPDRVEALIKHSYSRYGQHRKKVEMQIARQYRF